MDDTLILSPEELAAVTGGTWSDPGPLPELKRVALNPATTRPGDLLVTVNGDQWDGKRAATETDEFLELFSRRGGVAALVRRSASLNASVNLLRVDDTYRALVAIAAATRDKSRARRLLVTGTEGKTGFKVQFHHLASAQAAINARLDSNNMERGICTALANTRSHHAISVIEVAVPRRHLGRSRAQLVQPELCVITEIGYEHLSKHGGVEKLIAAKASVVSGLSPGGRCLIKSDPRYADRLRQAIGEYGDIPVLTFGEHPSDLGRLIDAAFDPRRYGWEVRAEIDGQEVTYFLPIVEQHAPLSSVAVLTAIHLMGLDVERAAERFGTLSPYQTSGRLYELPVAEGSYTVYDQSYRSYLLGLEDFFRTAARLEPRPGGRKILVLGHVYDEREYGSMVWQLIPPDRLRALIGSSGFDHVFTVGERTEFERIVGEDVVEWTHLDAPELVVPPLLGAVRPNDLVMVKGDLNERMFVITDGLRAHVPVDGERGQ